jgi:xanthine dehydrogenase YagR molybdenum-binding subunit
MTRLVKTRVYFEGRAHDEWALVDENDAARPWDVEEELQVVGRPHPRIDGAARVTGRARYTVDVVLPGQLHGAFVRSPYAHARVRSIDVAAAEALPGVWAVLTPENTRLEWRAGVNVLSDEPRFQGDEVAFVVADTPEQARAAAARVKVDYEPLPFVVDGEAARRPDAPSVRGTPENLQGGEPQRYARGDVARGFGEAEVVVEGTYRTPVALHNPLETHASVAVWEGEQLIVYDSTQAIFGVRNRLAELLGLPRDRVRVIKQYMGGGFGAKLGTGKQTVLAALAARRLGRPVKAVLGRREENLAVGNRSASVQRVKLGAKRDGTLTAIELEATAAVGAYAGWSPDLGGPYKELYRCANVNTTVYGVHTNTGTFTAFRAPGYVEATFGLECALDELAAALAMDPLELRRHNYTERDQERDIPYSSRGLMDAWLVGAERAGWPRVRSGGRAGVGDSGGSPLRRGWGMASQIWGAYGGPPAFAVARLNSDGSLVVQIGTQDIGTGTRTVLAQIAAEELSLPLERVTIELGDTQAAPHGAASGGSATVASNGPAVRSACADARRQLLEIAAQRHEYGGELALVDGKIVGPGFPPPGEKDGEGGEGGEDGGAGGAGVGQGLTIGALLGELGDVEVIGRGSRGPNVEDLAVQTFGAQFAEVEVDTETGAVRVLRVIAVHDCGRIINPLTTSSQVEGGVIQGVGYALTEQRVVDPASGVVLSDDLESYRIPTMLDAPAVETVMLDRADRAANNLGAKGVGEPPIIPTAAAIANAVYDATGVRVREIPITRDRLLAALEAARAAASGAGAADAGASGADASGANPAADAASESASSEEAE